ncbi:MAG: hypothetical protein DI585_01250 [Pseudomonas fluorescens]|nr:MAG: hypothetical protein DI585_01250 [Pseudomonas fluorescens]
MKNRFSLVVLLAITGVAVGYAGIAHAALNPNSTGYESMAPDAKSALVPTPVTETPAATADTATTEADKAAEKASDEEKEKAKKACEDAMAKQAERDSAANQKAVDEKCTQVDVAAKEPESKMTAANTEPKLTPAEQMKKDFLASAEQSGVAQELKKSADNFGGLVKGSDTTGNIAASDALQSYSNVKNDPFINAAADDAYVNTGAPTKTTLDTATLPDNIAQAQAQLSNQATKMMESGQWPDSVADRKKLAMQYLREKGYREEVVQQVMSTLYKENNTLDPNLCNPTSSACGLGQYINSTWKSGNSAADRWDVQAQLDRLATDVNKRYDNYISGKQTCGGIDLTSCLYGQHYAGSYSQAAINNGTFADSLKISAGKNASSMADYAKVASSLGGGDVNSILASMKTTQQTGLGATVAQTLGTGSGSISSGSTASVVSSLLSGGGTSSSLLNNVLMSSGLNTGQNQLVALLTQALNGQASTSNGSSGSSGTSGSSYTDTTVSVISTENSSKGYDVIKALQEICGGHLSTSMDANTLKINSCGTVASGQV